VKKVMRIYRKSEFSIYIVLIVAFFFACSSKNKIKFENNCHWKIIEELDSNIYVTDTFFLFKEICNVDCLRADYCNDFPNQNLSTLIHPGFIEILPELSIKQCYGKNYYCFANGTNIMAYRRYKGISNVLSKEEQDSIQYLEFKRFTKYKIISDSFIFYCDKKFNKISHRPQNDCLKMQGGKFIITYLPSIKSCWLSFRNPDKHLQVDQVFTKINFIVDLKEIK